MPLRFLRRDRRRSINRRVAAYNAPDAETALAGACRQSPLLGAFPEDFTMRTLIHSSVWSVAILLATAMLVGQEKGKEVTLKGSILCAHCALGEGDKCTTAIQVKEGDKLVTYYFDDKGTDESYHEAVCGGAKKEGTVVGKVEERGGKKYIKPSKVEYAKK
jgi:hypothetical protein